VSSSCLVKQELYECARSSYAQRFRTIVLVNQVHASIYSCQVKERLLSEALSIFKELVSSYLEHQGLLKAQLRLY
jgi:hypothetical protein